MLEENKPYITHRLQCIFYKLVTFIYMKTFIKYPRAPKIGKKLTSFKTFSNNRIYQIPKSITFGTNFGNRFKVANYKKVTCNYSLQHGVGLHLSNSEAPGLVSNRSFPI